MNYRIKVRKTVFLIEISKIDFVNISSLSLSLFLSLSLSLTHTHTHTHIFYWCYHHWLLMSNLEISAKGLKFEMYFARNHVTSYTYFFWFELVTLLYKLQNLLPLKILIEIRKVRPSIWFFPRNRPLYVFNENMRPVKKFSESRFKYRFWARGIARG
jgi:hypothetical protein